MSLSAESHGGKVQNTNRILSGNTSAFNGNSFNIDYGSYMARHDLVYLSPPRLGEQSMCLGDGDTSALIYAPGPLMVQLHRTDLWADPPMHPNIQNAGPAGNWRMISAGNISIQTEPSLVELPTRFEQRLSIHAGVITIDSESEAGSCQVTSFLSATAGVLVIHYKDQTLRGVQRRIEISGDRDAHSFALDNTIGIIHSLRDRRYAMAVRLHGKKSTFRQGAGKTAVLEVEPGRSSEFTLFAAVTTTPAGTDPIRSSKARVEAAIERGWEELLRDQRQHWASFWSRSFLHLSGGEEHGSLPDYLENLWYLNLYHQACMLRGNNAPLPGLTSYFPNGKYPGPALYEQNHLRSMMAPLLPSNHLELTLPFLETCYQELPMAAADTGRLFGISGVCLPPRSNRHGQGWNGESCKEAIAIKGEARCLEPDLANGCPLCKRDWTMSDGLNDGLATALLAWEAWRYAPDRFLLMERIYPILRSCVTFSVERASMDPGSLVPETERTRLAAALRAALWCSEYLDLNAENRMEWKRILNRIESVTPAYRPESLSPFSGCKPERTVETMLAWLNRSHQQAQGLFQNPGAPPTPSAEILTAAINSMLMREEASGAGNSQADREHEDELEILSGVRVEPIRLFPSLPAQWEAAFSFITPGGFRVMTEATGGKTKYVAVKSNLGGSFRLVNPWPGEIIRVRVGRDELLQTSSFVIEFETEPGGIYMIENTNYPTFRLVPVRFQGGRRTMPRSCGNLLLGLPVVKPDSSPQVSPRVLRKV